MFAFQVKSRSPGPSDSGPSHAVYIVAGMAYPLWHLLAPAGARDPWWVWWAIGSAFVVAVVVNRSVAPRGLGPNVLAACTALVTLHLLALASLNDMLPFYAVGSALAVVTASFSIRSRRVLLVFAGLVAATSAISYALAPDPRKLAYWGGMLPVMALAYWRLSAQLASAEWSRRHERELEARVQARTAELEEANRRLRRAAEEQEHLEEQLRLAQTMEALGRLAGGVAHEFNNLLTTIQLYAQLLDHQLASGSPLREEVERIQNAVSEAATLTEQLVDFGRGGDMEADVLDLNEVVRNASSMLALLVGEAVELTCRLDDTLPPIWADRGQLERILVNLALNARQAMPAGGTLVIETEATSGRAIDAWGMTRASDEEEWARLAVIDTGVGMDEQTRARAFDPFFSRSEGGSGLGLSVVYSIVTQAGGAVRAVSEPEKGACLELAWPRTWRRPHEGVTSASSSDGARAEERVLLVEDHPKVGEALAQVLREKGYEVLEAANVPDALEIAQGTEAKIDLVVSDVVMPGASGIELLERIAAYRPDARVLLISAYVDHPSLAGRRIPPGVPLLRKPFDAAELLARVRDVLDAPPPRCG